MKLLIREYWNENSRFSLGILRAQKFNISVKTSTQMARLIKLLFYLGYVLFAHNVGKIHCEQNTESTTLSPSSYSSSSAPTTSTEKPHIVTRNPFLSSVISASSSSSSSSEDQLAPLLFGNSGGGTANQRACVTCPQTVCTLSKVSYLRQAIHHNWRVDGLPDYFIYLEKFQAPFELTSDVRFNTTPPNDGQWTFTFTRSGYSPYPRQEQSSPLELRVTYRYTTVTRTPPKLAFDLWLSVHVEDEYVTLPSQIASHPTPSQVPVLSSEHFSTKNGFVYSWTYLFIWSDIQTKVTSLIESGGLESQVVEFKFVINSYQEGNISSAGANCQKWSREENGNESGLNPSNSQQYYPYQSAQGTYEVNPVKNATWPPFLKHMYTIMKDDKYTDLTVKSGDEEFQIHRVIAAYSSPVLATLIFNKTYEKSESLLDLGEDIGSDVVEELIRYMYTGKVEDIEEIADRLIVAATTYGFPALLKQCESALIKQVKTENAFNMYALGAEVGSMRLKRRAFTVMKENKSKIVAQSEEFRKLSVHHPDVMYELFLS